MKCLIPISWPLMRPCWAAHCSWGRILARGMPAALHAHGQMQRTVLIEFDSVEAANAAYRSAGYVEALAALDGGVVREVRIIEAVD